MKSSLRKLRGLAAHHRPDSKEKKRDGHPRAQLDELERASQDMQDMRNCYDSLLSAAAATTNCAYEFSESLGELGSCLLEKTALNDDEESGKVLLMLGKVQFELQKLVDIYRSHITQTISNPSESLLKELQNVEEMKRQCDEKREVYKHMLAAQREKGKPKNARENIVLQQLQAAQNDYDEEATLFVFRLKSLKRGQSRSLLTQAARHHSAQLTFFKKGIKSLEAVEPHVKLVAEKQHIDYQFSGLEDYGTEGDDNCNSIDDAYDANDDGELSFFYEQNEQVLDVSTSRNSMENKCFFDSTSSEKAEMGAERAFFSQLDQAVHTKASALEMAQEDLDKNQSDVLSFRRPWPGSQSAPLFADKKFDPVDRIKDMQPPSTKKFHTYVLPTPVDCKSSTVLSSKPAPSEKLGRMGGWPSQTQLWHSTPMEPRKHVKISRTDVLSNHADSKSVLTESNTNSEHNRMPPPLAEGLSSPPFKGMLDHLSTQFIPHNSDSKKFKRQAFSGPLPNKGWSNKPSYSIPSVQHQGVSTMPIRVPTPRSTSPNISPSASPPLVPSPKISELHELPRPPISSANPTRPSSLIGHSAPLVSRGRELSPARNIPPTSSQTASPLPTPPGVMTRSFSIPSRSQRTSLNVAALMEKHHNQDMSEEVSSPPITPISLTSPARISIAGTYDAMKTRVRQKSTASKIMILPRSVGKVFTPAYICFLLCPCAIPPRKTLN
ncbi:hypothetical protein Taro_007023, partial [Colocasia esculenta]|nr:hypothetical protein [Colocasia esculenta]